MLSNIKNHSLFIFFSDIFNVFKKTIYLVSKIIVANYKTPNNNNNNNNNNINHFSKTLVSKTHGSKKKVKKIKPNKINIIKKPSFKRTVIPAKQKTDEKTLGAFNFNDNGHFYINVNKDNNNINSALNSMLVTSDITADNNIFEKPKHKTWETMTHINRPWFINK